MTEYRVRWEIDIDAENPREAAIRALKVQRDASSGATYFEVTDQEGTVKAVDIDGRITKEGRTIKR